MMMPRGEWLSLKPAALPCLRDPQVRFGDRILGAPDNGNVQLDVVRISCAGFQLLRQNKGPGLEEKNVVESQSLRDWMVNHGPPLLSFDADSKNDDLLTSPLAPRRSAPLWTIGTIAQQVKVKKADLPGSQL
jgi:hypothetical protein